jgi:hypothetical protein
MLEPEKVESSIGKAEVLTQFKIPKIGFIAAGTDFIKKENSAQFFGGIVYFNVRYCERAE